MTAPHDPDREPPVWPSPPAPPPPPGPGYAGPPPTQQPYPQQPVPPQPYQQPYQQPFQQQPYAAPGQYPPGPLPSAPKSNRVILIVALVVLVLIGAGTAVFFLVSGKSKSTPSLSESRTQIATNAEAFLHALGHGNPAVFCKLWDPANLQTALSKNQISSCDHIELTSTSSKDLYSSIKVVDPARITVSGSSATIPAGDFDPTRDTDLKLVHESDGQWRVAFFRSR